MKLLSQKTKLLNQSGSALIQMVAAISFLAILFTAIEMILQNSQNQIRNTVNKAAREELKDNIESIFLIHPTCACSFNNISIPAVAIAGYASGDADITELKITNPGCAGDLLTLARINTKVFGVKTKKIIVRNIVDDGTGSLSAELYIESANDTAAGEATVVDQIPFRISTAPDPMNPANLKISSCSGFTQPESEIEAIVAAPVYIRHSGAAQVTYTIPELAGAGRQLVLAKINIYYADNIRINIFDISGINPPQNIQSRTGADGHIWGDTILARIPTVNGQFRMSLDCINSNNENPRCTEIWNGSQDHRMRITPQAIISVPD